MESYGALVTNGLCVIVSCFIVLWTMTVPEPKPVGKMPPATPPPPSFVGEVFGSPWPHPSPLLLAVGVVLEVALEGALEGAMEVALEGADVPNPDKSLFQGQKPVHGLGGGFTELVVLVALVDGTRVKVVVVCTVVSMVTAIVVLLIDCGVGVEETTPSVPGPLCCLPCLAM